MEQHDSAEQNKPNLKSKESLFEKPKLRKMKNGYGWRFKSETGGGLKPKYTFCYVALITDVFSNTIVGFMVSTKCDKKLVLDALFMAIARRGPGVQLVHHSDRGSQYFSLRYMETLEENLIIQSTGRTGNSYDNATSESINSRFKAELIYNKKGVVKWTSHLVVATETSKYVYWWNNERLQERLGFLTPKEFEENYYKSPTTAA